MSLPCADCAAGALHGGTPKGKVQTVHGLPTYVAEPTGPAKGIVVILADAFGWELVNNRILADSYAEKGGFQVLLPDFFDGHWLAHDLLYSLETAMSSKESLLARVSSGLRGFVNFLPFIFFNRFSITGPRVYKFFSQLRAQSPQSKIGAAGFCWGGKFVTYLASPSWVSDSPSNAWWPAPGPKQGDFLIDAGYMAHPSMLALPTDVQSIQVPVSLAHASEDHIPQDKAKEMCDILREKEKCEVVVYDGAKHGFAIRGDPRDEKVKRQGTEAEDQAIAFFKRHLT